MKTTTGCLRFLLLALLSSSIECSGLFGVSMSQITNFLSPVLKECNLGELITCETALYTEFDTAKERLRERCLDQASYRCKPCPEAFALDPTILGTVANTMESLMDPRLKHTEQSHKKFVSKHIFIHREEGTETTFIYYRPSLRARLDPSKGLPQLKYHEEAQSTFESVRVAAIEPHPHDQFIFVGLEDGGAVALLHAWMALSRVDSLMKPFIEFNGDLHQIKVIMFDTDCVLTAGYVASYPIPARDILRFHSSQASSECTIRGLTHIGLPYVYKGASFTSAMPSFSKWMVRTDASTLARTQFAEYYGIDDDKQEASKSECGGTKEASSDVESDISDPDEEAFEEKTSTVPPVPYSDKIIRDGIELLKSARKIAQLYNSHAKNIFVDNQRSYIERDVNDCSAAMSARLSSTLFGTSDAQSSVASDIESVECGVKAYDIATKIAEVHCSLTDKRKHTIVLKFSVRVDMDDAPPVGGMATQNPSIRKDRSRSCSTSHETASNSCPEDGSVACSNRLWDGKTAYTKQTDPRWNGCLRDLFSTSTLTFLDPTREGNVPLSIGALKSHNQDAGESISYGQKGHRSKSAELRLPITLHSSSNKAQCEFKLQTSAKDYEQFFKTHPNLFYSIFTATTKLNAVPASCANILRLPFVRDGMGNAGHHLDILNSFFNCLESPSVANNVVGRVEISDACTNLPSGNAYDIFNDPAMKQKLGSCILDAQRQKNLVDCSKHVSRWSGFEECPSLCQRVPFGSMHLCSRIVACGDGVFIGFRGTSKYEHNPLTTQFEPVTRLTDGNGFYTAFTLKYLDASAVNFLAPWGCDLVVFMNQDVLTWFKPSEFARPYRTEAGKSGSQAARRASDEQEDNDDDDGVDNFSPNDRVVPSDQDMERNAAWNEEVTNEPVAVELNQNMQTVEVPMSLETVSSNVTTALETQLVASETTNTETNVTGNTSSKKSKKKKGPT